MADSTPGNKFLGKSRLLPATVIVVVGVVVYANSFSAPFVLDDKNRIAGNPSIRQVWPPWGWLTYNPRPVAYLSFALNYAASGLNIGPYRVTNLTIHVVAALVLFGIARRTFTRDPVGRRYGKAAAELALLIALVWMVHPLQTQSVSYLVQRIEALMGLFFLLTLYCFIRAQDSTGGCGPVSRPQPGSRDKWWYAASVACCTLGVATKEVAAMAPLVVLWYDRAFVSPSWRELYVKRRWYYLGLFATWCLPALLMVSRWETYGGAAGSVEGLSALDYALSQPGVICRYLRLSIIPIGQCLDYAWPVASTMGEVVPPLLLVLALLGLTVWSVVRHPCWSFLGGWFFLILAPTSSIVPIADLAFEHRMYLPLAAVVVAFVVGSYEIGQCFAAEKAGAQKLGLFLCRMWLIVPLGAIVLLGYLTILRNEVYRSEERMWRDVVSKAPHNPRAYANLANAVQDAGELDEAMCLYRKTLELDPKYVIALHGLGLMLYEQGHLGEAIEYQQRALAERPDFVPALHALAMARRDQGRLSDAFRLWRQAVEIDPAYLPAYNDWGIALHRQHQLAEAEEVFEAALRVDPSYARAHYNLANVLRDQRRHNAAIHHYRKAVEIDPGYASAHFNLANLLRDRRRFEEAIDHYRDTVRIDPKHARAHVNWGTVLYSQGRFGAAREHFQRAVEIDPKNEPARRNLASADVNLGVLLLQQGKRDAAIKHFREALRMAPDLRAAQENLDRALAE